MFLLCSVRNEVISARPRDTANDDNDEGSEGGDDKDPTTLTSHTTDALCKTFFITTPIGPAVDDGV